MKQRRKKINRYIGGTCLPYGSVLLPSRRELLFNRGYRPLFERYGTDEPKPIIHFEWVGEWWLHNKPNSYLYTDTTPDGEKWRRGVDTLRLWGVDVSGSRLEICEQVAALTHQELDPPEELREFGIGPLRLWDAERLASVRYVKNWNGVPDERRPQQEDRQQ